MGLGQHKKVGSNMATKAKAQAKAKAKATPVAKATPAAKAEPAAPTKVLYAKLQKAEVLGYTVKLVPGKGKRPGTASAQRFALYTDGQTVAEALAAGVWWADVRWDVAHGLITLHP